MCACVCARAIIEHALIEDFMEITILLTDDSRTSIFLFFVCEQIAAAKCARRRAIEITIMFAAL